MGKWPYPNTGLAAASKTRDRSGHMCICSGITQAPEVYGDISSIAASRRVVMTTGRHFLLKSRRILLFFPFTHLEQFQKWNGWCHGGFGKSASRMHFLSPTQKKRRPQSVRHKIMGFTCVFLVPGHVLFPKSFLLPFVWQSPLVFTVLVHKDERALSRFVYLCPKNNKRKMFFLKKKSLIIFITVASIVDGKRKVGMKWVHNEGLRKETSAALTKSF